MKIWALPLLLLMPLIQSGQQLPPEALLKPLDGSWPTYNGDYTGRRFSTLTSMPGTGRCAPSR